MTIVVVTENAPALITTVCVPGGGGLTCVTQPWATDVPVDPAGSPKMLSAGSVRFISAVSTPATVSGLPSKVIDGAVCRSLERAQARSSASVVPLPSKVLHSTLDPVMKSGVPAPVVHDARPGPTGPNGASVPPTFQQAVEGSPVPKGFCGVGVVNTFVHSAARVSCAFFVGVAAAGDAAARARLAVATTRQATEANARHPLWTPLIRVDVLDDPSRDGDTGPPAMSVAVVHGAVNARATPPRRRPAHLSGRSTAIAPPGCHGQ